MAYPNNQGNPNASIPVWIDVQPSAVGPYSNNKNLTGGAIPVYEVAAPTNTSGPYPNNQGTSTSGVNQGAIPVRIVAQPSGAGSTSNDPSNDLAAIPVWVVGSSTGILAAYPNLQGAPVGSIPSGAIPVWVV